MKLFSFATALALILLAAGFYYSSKRHGIRAASAEAPIAAARDPHSGAGTTSPASSPDLSRVVVPELARAAELPADSKTEPPTASPRYAYSFLPAELQPLSSMIPERLEAFDKATPVEQLQLGRELLVHSVAVIMCATGAGPVQPGQPGEGDLSYAGRDGRWSFQINTSTFHFHESEYPEYPEYMRLLRSSYDDQMVPLPTPVELTPDLVQRIRMRAQEALAWL